MKVLRRFRTKNNYLIVCKLVECNEKYYWIRDNEIQCDGINGFVLRENCDHVPIVIDRIITETIGFSSKLAKYGLEGTFYIEFLDSDFTDVYFSSDQADDQPH